MTAQTPESVPDYLMDPFSHPGASEPGIPRDPMYDERLIRIRERAVVAALMTEIDYLQGQNQATKAEMQALVEYYDARVNGLKFDTMTGLITRTGIADELTENDDLRAELLHPYRPVEEGEDVRERWQEPRWGVVSLDVRGVKAVNDLKGDHVGDAFITVAMQQISDAVHRLSRQRERRHDERAVAQHGRASDKVIRWGGDEVAILARQVRAYGLEQLALRLAEEFSLERALEKYRAYEQAIVSGLPPEEWEPMELPIIAGIGQAFTDYNLQHRPVEKAMSEGDLFGVALQLYRYADYQQKDIKKLQYDWMWNQYVSTLGYDESKLVVKPGDERKIMELFWKSHMPLFYNDVEAYIDNVQRSQQAAIGRRQA